MSEDRTQLGTGTRTCPEVFFPVVSMPARAVAARFTLVVANKVRIVRQRSLTTAASRREVRARRKSKNRLHPKAVQDHLEQRHQSGQAVHNEGTRVPRNAFQGLTPTTCTQE